MTNRRTTKICDSNAPAYDNINKMILYALMTEYFILLVWVIALKCNASWVKDVGEELRSLPFKQRIGHSIIPFYDLVTSGEYFDMDYFLNVLIYIPFGLFLPFISERRSLLNIGIIFTSSVLFETVQLITGFGGWDSTDMACNTIGGAIGIMTYNLFRKHITDKKINHIAFFALVIFLPIVIYAIINTAVNRDLYVISFLKTAF